MGSGIVFLVWLAFDAFLAAFASRFLVHLTGRLVPQNSSGRNRALRAAKYLPWVGLAYFFGWVLAYGAFSEARGRDGGYGDLWLAPLSDRYSIVMIDVTDEASIVKRSAGDNVGFACGPDAICGVLRLEVRGSLLFGTATETVFPAPGPATRFFGLDIKTDERTGFPSLAALDEAARQHGGPLRLEPVATIFSRFRYGREDLLFLVGGLVLPGSSVLALFALRINRLRRKTRLA